MKVEDFAEEVLSQLQKDTDCELIIYDWELLPQWKDLRDMDDERCEAVVIKIEGYSYEPIWRFNTLQEINELARKHGFYLAYLEWDGLNMMFELEFRRKKEV